jgi:hypothetical protein
MLYVASNIYTQLAIRQAESALLDIRYTITQRDNSESKSVGISPKVVTLTLCCSAYKPPKSIRVKVPSFSHGSGVHVDSLQNAGWLGHELEENYHNGHSKRRAVSICQRLVLSVYYSMKRLDDSILPNTLTSVGYYWRVRISASFLPTTLTYDFIFHSSFGISKVNR